MTTMSTGRKWLFVRLMVLVFFPFGFVFELFAYGASEGVGILLFLVWLGFVALVVLAYRYTVEVRREGLNRRPAKPGHRCTLCGGEHLEDVCPLPQESLRRLTAEEH